MLKGVINSAIQNNAELLKISPTSDATKNPDNIKIGKWAIKKLILSCLATSGLIVFIRATRCKKYPYKMDALIK